ncbi:hypothetical protein WJX77_002505 [Trebouxia sp. C0004]
MADTVRYFMEDMVPELDDLEERGYFKKAEIKQIVKKRTHFEYLLKRPAAVKTDFLRYAEYETKLEELRAHRKAITGLKGKTTLADYAIVRRIHLIYERATRKFRGDLRVWLQWLHFCRSSGSTRQISRVLTKALQLHPAASGLWSYAAAWEFEHNSNAGAARTLMQRGLRMCKTSQQLWLEYFRMELMYAHKLRTRRRVLGIDDSAVATQAVTQQNDLEDQLNSAEKDDQAGHAAIQVVLSGAVATVVYKSAIQAIPHSLDFRYSFLKLLSQFKFEGIAAIQQAVLDSIHTDFGDTEESWKLRAAAATDSAELPSSQAVIVFEDALTIHPTGRMYSLYSEYLRDCLSQQSAAPQPQDDQLSPEQQATAEQLLQLYKRAYEAGSAEEGMLLHWPHLALQAGQEEQALQGAAAACQALPASSAVWEQRLSLQARHATLQVCQSGEGEQAGAMVKAGRQLESLALQAVAAVDPREADGVCMMAFERLTALGSSSKRLIQALVHRLTGLQKGPLRGGMGCVAGAAVDMTRQLQSLPAARKLCDSLLTIPSPGGSFFQAAISMELAVMTPETIPRIQRLFEAGVGSHGTEDHELWLQYAAFEQQHLKGAGHIYWRAVKALESPDSFVSACSGA